MTYHAPEHIATFVKNDDGQRYLAKKWNTEIWPNTKILIDQINTCIWNIQCYLFNTTNVTLDRWTTNHLFCEILMNTVACLFVCLFLWWCLTPLSIIIQLYRGGQFYWVRKQEEPEKTTDLSQIRQTLSHNVVHRYLALIEIRTHNIGGDRHWLHM